MKNPVYKSLLKDMENEHEVEQSRKRREFLLASYKSESLMSINKISSKKRMQLQYKRGQRKNSHVNPLTMSQRSGVTRTRGSNFSIYSWSHGHKSYSPVSTRQGWTSGSPITSFLCWMLQTGPERLLTKHSLEASEDYHFKNLNWYELINSKQRPNTQNPLFKS